MKICPADWLEGIAMVATGGIYCQFKQAEYILDDFKAQVQRIRTEGEAERDQLESRYSAENTAQITALKDAIAKKQATLQRLLESAVELLNRARGHAIDKNLAAKVAVPSKSVGPLAARVAAGSRAPQLTTPSIDGQTGGTAAKVPFGFPTNAGTVEQLIDESKQRTDARANGPFTSAGAELDRLTQVATDELRKGYDSELFAPLVAMVSGLPPPDPLTLYAVMNFTRLELLRIINSKNDWLRDVRSRNDAALDAQSTALAEEYEALLQALARAIKEAMALLESLRVALDFPSPANEASLEGAIASVRNDRAGVSPEAQVAAPAATSTRWAQLAVPTSQLDQVCQSALALIETPPAKASAEALAQLSTSARTTIRDRLAKGTLAQLEADVRTRFANDPKTLSDTIAWMKAEASKP